MIQTADNHHWSSMYSTMITLVGLGDVQKPIGSMICPPLTLHLTSELMFMYIITLFSAGSLYIHKLQPRLGKAKAKP